MLKRIRPGRKYIIINIDEPYAEEAYKILKKGQMKKGEWPEGDISFEEWKKLTWSSIDTSQKRSVNDRVQIEKETTTKKVLPLRKRGRARIGRKV